MENEADGLYNNDWINTNGNQVHKTAIIHPNVEMGKGNIIGAYSVIGGNGEIRNTDWTEFKGKVVIGDNNTISEFVSIQRPLEEGQTTNIGSNNIIMAHCHVGHDAKIGDNIELSSGAIIGGYAQISDGAQIKLGAIIRNQAKIGPNALVGMGGVVVNDINADEIVVGNPASFLRKR